MAHVTRYFAKKKSKFYQLVHVSTAELYIRHQVNTSRT